MTARGHPVPTVRYYGQVAATILTESTLSFGELAAEEADAVGGWLGDVAEVV